MIISYGVYVIINWVSFLWTFYPEKIPGSETSGVCYVVSNNKTLDNIIWDIQELFYDFCIQWMIISQIWPKEGLFNKYNDKKLYPKMNSNPVTSL